MALRQLSTSVAAARSLNHITDGQQSGWYRRILVSTLIIKVETEGSGAGERGRALAQMAGCGYFRVPEKDSSLISARQAARPGLQQTECHGQLLEEKHQQVVAELSELVEEWMLGPHSRGLSIQKADRQIL